MNLLTKTVLTTTLLGAAGFAAAGPGHPGHGPAGAPDAVVSRHLAKTVQRLDLSAEQEAAIQSIFEANREDMKANREAQRALRTELETVFEAAVFDEAALAELAVREGELAEERVLLMGTVASEVLAELDEAQRAELQALRAEREDRRRDRFSDRRRGD